MRKILRVAWRDYKANVCTKAFIIGLVVAPLFMGGSAIVVALTKDRVDTRDRKVAVVDRSGLAAGALIAAAEKRNSRELHDGTTGKKVRPAYVFETVAPSEGDPRLQMLELSDRVRRGELHAFLTIEKGILHPSGDPSTFRIAYHSENPAMDEVRRWVERPINEALRSRRLAEAGIAESAVPDLFDWIGAEGFGLISADQQTGKIGEAERASEIRAVLLPIIPVILLFMLVMMGCMPQLQSVTEEKSQRIAEVILGCLRPFQFMMGKLLGGVGVSLTGAAVYVCGGIGTIVYLGLGQYVPYAVLPWFFAFLVFSIFLYGALLAALGSACNDATEAQAVTLPAMLPLLIPLFVVMPVIQEPNGTLATGLSFFPLFTPFLMLLRIGTPAGVPAWQPWAGIFEVALTTLLFVWAGGRIFRVGLLVHGTPPKIGNLLRWALHG